MLLTIKFVLWSATSNLILDYNNFLAMLSATAAIPQLTELALDLHCCGFNSQPDGPLLNFHSRSQFGLKIEIFQHSKFSFTRNVNSTRKMAFYDHFHV